MDKQVEQDLSESASLFTNVVWPGIRNLFGRGDIEPVEGIKDDDFKKKLDMYAGIDAWQIQPSKSRMRGIASRVQKIRHGGKPYNSFTVRYERSSGAATEYVKRLAALHDPVDGWAFPAITVQSYVDEQSGELLAAGGIKTQYLLDYIVNSDEVSYEESRYRGYSIKTNPQDGNKYIVVFWQALENAGVKVIRCNNQEA